MMFKKFTYKFLKDNRGYLLPVSFKKNLGFTVKRIFFISGNQKLTRGNHAHKKCIQSFLQIIGSSKIEAYSKNKKKIFSLNSKKKIGVTIFPKTWIKINFKSKKNLILVLCSHDYDKKDYIKSIEKLN